MIPKTIVTAADGEFLQAKGSMVRAAILSWILLFPDSKIDLYTDNLEIAQSFQDIEYGHYVNTRPLPNWFHIGDYWFRDAIRFCSYTQQSERFMWIDPDCFALKLFAKEQLDRFDTVGFYGYSKETTTIYDPVRFAKSLSKSKLQEYYQNYGSITPRFGTNPGFQIMDPEVGYAIGSEVLHYGYRTRPVQPYVHNFLTQGLPIQVLKRFNIPFEIFEGPETTSYLFHIDSGFDVLGNSSLQFWNKLFEERRVPTLEEMWELVRIQGK